MLPEDRRDYIKDPNRLDIERNWTLRPFLDNSSSFFILQFILYNLKISSIFNLIVKKYIFHIKKNTKFIKFWKYYDFYYLLYVHIY